jgi:soluble lytic murein transglycosylase
MSYLEQKGSYKTVLLVVIVTLLFAAGCVTEPVEVDSVPISAPTVSNLQPTPTLAPGVPTPPLPTPPITPSAEAEESQVETASPASEGPVTATPEILERLDLGHDALTYENHAAAIEQFISALQQEASLEPESQADILYKLGIAYLAEGEVGDAATMFNQLLGLAGDNAPAEAHFHLAQASVMLGDYDTAVDAYQTYLDAHPDMAAYIYPFIAETYLALGDSGAALDAYEAALIGSSHRLKEYETRQILADYYLADGDYEAAIEQYEAIFNFAQTEKTRGQMTFLAGAAELQSGNIDAAHERFLTGVSEYPGVYESYLGLVELVKVEVAVDDFQRGLVDFNAAAYAPGIDAFEAHITANPENYQPDAHLYLAWSYEALEDLEAAFAELDRYAEYEPSSALFEQAKMRARVGETEAAIDLYQQFLAAYPEDEEAPLAAWRAASLIEQMGDVESAIELFLDLANEYPDHEDAPEALYHAGWLAQNNEDMGTAFILWQRASEEYTESQFGSAALVRLLRAKQDIEDDLLADLQELAVNNVSADYPALRARDIAAGIDPFDSSTPFSLPTADLADQEDAESWLLNQLEQTPEDIDGALGELGPELVEDERLLIGEKLWGLRLFEEAKIELETLRESKADSLLDSYQLALFFRDLGLYRSSIIAGATVLDIAEQSVLEAPPFIGRLAYPIPYADHILPLSAEYGYDPRLQFSLVRQESLFESFARSGAAAQGLSQVIPDTGAWIAEQLQWPDYENEDLYKPYVGLEFGAYYLSEQLEAFDGDIHAALAAYNAGPGNAARWYDLAGGDIDQFIDVMDFWETRTYVERIYAGFDIYRNLYEP